ncbi:MAG: hypothetical protein ACP5MB_10390 [bacterium]
MALGIDDLILFAVVAALGGAAAYEYAKANPLPISQTQQTQSSENPAPGGVVISAQPYVNQPPLLYDPIISKLPHPTIEYQYANPYLTLNPETGNPEYSGGTTVTSSSHAAQPSNTTASVSPTTTASVPTTPQSSAAIGSMILPASTSEAAAPAVNALNYKLYEINTNLQHVAASSQYTSAGIADMLAKQYNDLIKEFGPLPANLYNGYSAGLNGYATVPVYNSEGKIVSVVAINNATEGKYSNVNLLSTTGNPHEGTSISANQIISSTPANTVVGYTQTNGPGTKYAPTYSAGSTWQGPGEYISATGAPSYISSVQQYNEQMKLGYLGPGTQNTAYSGGYFSKTSIKSSGTPAPATPASSQAPAGSKIAVNQPASTGGSQAPASQQQTSTNAIIKQIKSGQWYSPVGGGSQASTSQPSTTSTTSTSTSTPTTSTPTTSTSTSTSTSTTSTIVPTTSTSTSTTSTIPTTTVIPATSTSTSTTSTSTSIPTTTINYLTNTSKGFIQNVTHSIISGYNNTSENFTSAVENMTKGLATINATQNVTTEKKTAMPSGGSSSGGGIFGGIFSHFKW